MGTIILHKFQIGTFMEILRINDKNSLNKMVHKLDQFNNKTNIYLCNVVMGHAFSGPKNLIFHCFPHVS